MRVTQAFILGAGVGNRLRPITDRLPKPLVPLFHRPLAQWAMLACARVGIRRFAINTHHLPVAWESLGPPGMDGGVSVRGGNGLAAEVRMWEGKEVSLFHESELLETGGGLKNIANWIVEKSLLVHNGDIFSTMLLEKLLAAHETSGLPVTLALRSEGEAKHIALDSTMTRVTDIRRRLDRAEGTHVFSGIYCVNHDFLEMIPANEKISIIPAFLQLSKRAELGAIVLDEGVWLDLGNRESYLQAHRDLQLGPEVHPLAVIGAGCSIERSVIGSGAVIKPGAIIRDSVIWADSRVGSDAVLDRCIVYSGHAVTGMHSGEDL